MISKAIVGIVGWDVSQGFDGRPEFKKGCGNKAIEPGAFLLVRCTSHSY